MTKFEEELKLGNFVCSECPNCSKLVWPANDFCNKCFGKVIWRKVSTFAKLIEFSKQGDLVFCIAEFENEIRVMGSLECDRSPRLGESLRLVRCGIIGNEGFIFKLTN